MIDTNESQNDIRVKAAINLIHVIDGLKMAKYHANNLKGIKAQNEFEKKKISEIELLMNAVINDINNFKE